MQATSRAAAWAPRFGGAALALLAIGPLLTHAGVTAPLGGFLVFQLGLLLGLVTLVVAIVGVLRTGARSGRAGRRHALTGLALGAATLAVVVFAARDGAGLPAINDITTSPDDPPEFTAVRELEPNLGRDMSYPGEEFAAQQRAAYPDLAPIALDAPPVAALAQVRDSARALGWEIVAEDEQARHLEATDTTAIFRFVDDVVVRVRAHGDGSLVDVRSKSRDGRGDLGANAERIRALRDALAD